jgi:hypothetical protein
MDNQPKKLPQKLLVTYASFLIWIPCLTYSETNPITRYLRHRLPVPAHTELYLLTGHRVEGCLEPHSGRHRDTISKKGRTQVRDSNSDFRIKTLGN